ncbi:CCAAT/enhancer-binding protein zeta [Pimephales promelas]|uniref:CCAAT/enhancer-binding protein zeta n=1 Tax=Pimephales promelas TaxID=90988 RepID=UPI001955988F|nr:CCAAT/enhancer-binding protein zeta [Pimephales promelas]KAG1928747.1 CCAAT/enhancer-binding protein zeta [Pimephales promelas]
MEEHDQEGNNSMDANNDQECEEEDCDPTEDDNNEEEFSLDDVLRLGGTKADYVMLANISDSNELLNGGKKNAIDDLEKGELEEFITKLGIRAYAGQQIIPDEQDEISSEPSKKEGKKAKSSKLKEDSKPAVKNAIKPSTEELKQPPVKFTQLEKKQKKQKQKSTNLFEFYPRQALLLKPGGKWFDMEYASESTSVPQNESLVAQYKALAQKLYENETVLYKTKKNFQKGANSTWMKSVVSTGTLTDRMAAMTVLIQDAPVHGLEHIESLVSQVKKKGSRRQGLMALDTLKELLLSDLLPNNRKLLTFSQRPFDQLEEKASGNRDVRDRRLILWYFEHQLKFQMAEFVVALDAMAHDTVQTSKVRSLSTAYELLCNQPEQEKALLVQVVNKLGDPEYKIACKASHLLETVIHKHPNMKTVVCCEVERLMFRSNISSKAQYYAACFLNQVILSHEEADLAARLITIYFTFFNACVKKKDIESKMLSALLTGVNRAYPYAKSGDENVCKQLDTLFKVVHIVRFNTAVQALMLLFQVMNSQQTISDRYYVALYRKLLDPGLLSCSKKSMFLNLLYKSLKADIVIRRVKAFVKRLLQVSCEQNPDFICGALFLVSEVMKDKPGLKLLLQDEGDDEEEVYQDLEEDSDDEEKPVDPNRDLQKQSAKQCQMKPTASWVHHQNLEGGVKKEMYDPMNRNPLYCGADHTGLWELQKLSLHFHPSVALFAKTLLQGEFILYTGDPLQDFTLIRFLDRFVYRNPKQMKGKQNTDATLMQPKYRRTLSNVKSLPVNCDEYLAKEESQIPVDEVFFYRYFKKRDAEKRWKRPNRKDDNESVEDVDDDEFDRVLDAFEGDSFFTEFKDDDLDFASNVTPKSKKGEDPEDSASDSDLDDLDDEEVSLGSMEDFEDELEDEGGEFMETEDAAADDDDDDEEAGARPKKKRKRTKDQAVFASAEEFGCLLEENAGLKFENTGMNAMANTDKADVKQLKWEVQRNDWICGRDVQTLRRKKASFNKRKFGGTKKRQSVNRKKIKT